MKATKDIAIEKTDFGPGKTALYYNNKGLFSDPFLEERLPNLEEYYNHPSTRFLNDYWNIDESDAIKFNNAFQDVMNLWNDLDQDVSSFCANERQLQNRWIDRIFEILGWTIELEESSSKHGITNYPDYALFASNDDWKKSKSLSGNHKFKKATAVADAKGWGINLDGKGYSNKNPSYQIINYLKQTDKNWGILTDGKFWRIYSLRSESKHTTYYEIDLEKILAANDYDRFKYFYNFFRVEAFINDARLSDRSFLDFVFEDGQMYSQRVESNLQARVYKVVDSICQGFLSNMNNPTEEELKEVYEYSMYHLFKLMFVLNCESKGLLEVNKQDDYYEFSLRKKCIEIKEQSEAGKNWSQQPRTYNYIRDLFNLLKTGDESIGVYGFGNEPFEIGGLDFYEQNKISDHFLNNAILELSCDKDEEGNLQFIDYKILSPDHIGSLFEGLLEFNLVRRGKKIELLNTKGDRKSTGSYYTPEYLVDHIVEETLSSVVSDKTTSEILKLKILDPAMGSGHFLLGVVKYIENKIIETQEAGKSSIKDAVNFDQIRKLVLHNCVFGVDVNALAVQLAKFSLWIYTSQKGDKLEPLNDQLKNADSLSDDFRWDNEFHGQVVDGLFDVVIGNPPYVGESGSKELFRKIKNTSLGEKYYNGKMDLFYFFFHLGLNRLKKNGLLSFVTTNYYYSADGAIKLRQDIKERATILKIENFNEFKIFKGAQGQHNSVTTLRLGKNVKQKCEIFNYVGKGAFSQEILKSKSAKVVKSLNLSNAEIFHGDLNYIKVNSAGSSKESSDTVKLMESFDYKVSDYFNVNQGIVTGVNKVSKKHLEKYPHLKLSANEGVFILEADEAKVFLNDAACKKYIKPLFKNSDISEFKASNSPSKYLIYISPDNCSFSTLPTKLKKHIERFMPILEDSVDNPPYLHRAREENIFLGEKIVVPYRCKKNIFGYTENPWYAAQDVYFITQKKQSFPMKALLAILNSSYYHQWLWNMGKRKGNMLELMNTPLLNLPLPRLEKEDIKQLEKISEYFIKGHNFNQEALDKIVGKILFGKYQVTKQVA